MKQNEILEGNKLIAEFMGWKFKESKPYKVWDPKFISDEQPPNDWLMTTWIIEDFKSYLMKTLKFHSSWDWLIPVIEKIEQFDNGVCSVLITGKACDIAFSTKYNMQGEDYDAPNFIKIEGSKISSAWSTVVDFIKWHNSLNHKI